MKRVLTLVLVFCAVGLFGQNIVNLHYDDDLVFSERIDNIDSLKSTADNLQVFLKDRLTIPTFSFEILDSVTFSKEEIGILNYVYIDFSDLGVSVDNPFSSKGLDVVANGTAVEIISNASLYNVVYRISGICKEASIVINSDVNFGLELVNANLSLSKGTIIANKKDVKMVINIPLGTSSQLNGATKAGISSSGPIDIIGRGELILSSSAADYKAIKSDADISLNGADLKFNISGDQSKAISSKSSIYIDGSVIEMSLSGNTVLEEDCLGYDPSYCTGFKADVDLYFNSGSLKIDHTGDGGKGISIDGSLYVNGGIINITTSGGGAVYKDYENIADSYTATAIKADGEIYFNKGVVTCKSTGEAGKGVSADGNIFIGEKGVDNSLLNLTVSTLGARFYVSGSGENADYANPKAIKSDANVTVNSGIITINCTQTTEGGEGLESKNVMVIDGGEIYIYSKMDDAINAKNSLGVNGGTIYARSDGNDGADSNGTFTMTGGLFISCGSRAPEAGIDCDQNKFTITGGILIATGGSTSYPNAGEQHSIIYNATAGQAICLKDADGKMLFCYQLPTMGNSGMMAPPTPPGGGGPGDRPGGGSGIVLVMTHPSIVKSSSYTLLYGGTILGGTAFNGYYVDAEYQGGTSKSISTGSSFYTNVK